MSYETASLHGRSVQLVCLIYALAKELTMITDSVITFLSCRSFRRSYFREIVHQDALVIDGRIAAVSSCYNVTLQRKETDMQWDCAF